MLSFKTIAILATAITTTMAQDPNPPLGGSDCRIQAEAGFHFHQVVLRTTINCGKICEDFGRELNSACDQTDVTCDCDINSPQLKYFWFETDSTCDGPAVEGAIARSTGETYPVCNLTN